MSILKEYQLSENLIMIKRGLFNTPFILFTTLIIVFFTHFLRHNIIAVGFCNNYGKEQNTLAYTHTLGRIRLGDTSKMFLHQFNNLSSTSHFEVCLHYLYRLHNSDEYFTSCYRNMTIKINNLPHY